MRFLILVLAVLLYPFTGFAQTPQPPPSTGASSSIPVYEGGTGTPTAEEIAVFKANINDSLMNRPGSYPWGESYIMMALMEMYKAVGDPFFLDKMVEHVDAVIVHRDDLESPPLVDEVRGKVMPAWGSSSYGPRSVYLVHSGMIAYPIAAFARIVLEDPNLHPQYGAKASYYLGRVRETLDAFDAEGEWIDVSAEEGYYYCPQPGILGEGPLNGMTAVGRALIETWLACGDPKYCLRAEKIGMRFRSQLIHHLPGDWYSWLYWQRETAPEDVCHGAIDVDFAALAWRNGIVFSRTDIERFARTLVDVMVQPDGYHLSYYVDGTLHATNDSTQSASRWLDLSQVDARVYDLVYKIQVVHGLRTVQQIDYAKLLKWKPGPFVPSLWAVR